MWRTRASPGPGRADLDLFPAQDFGTAGGVDANGVRHRCSPGAMRRADQAASARNVAKPATVSSERAGEMRERERRRRRRTSPRISSSIDFGRKRRERREPAEEAGDREQAQLRREIVARGEVRDREADEIAADEVRGERAERKVRRRAD